MKQKLRQVFKIGVFTTLLLTFGCSEDEPNVHDEHSGEHHLIKEVSFEELLTQPEFSDAYGKVAKTMHKNGSSLNARTAMEEQYGFTISNAPAKVIEKDSLTSYTLKIDREIQDPSYFENLVLQVDEENEVKAVIFKYILNSEPLPTADGSFNLDARVEITPIIYDTSVAGKTTICISYSVLYCNNGIHGGIGPVHPAGANCTSTYWGTKTVCSSDDGGTPINGETPIDAGTSGGGGGTAPTPPCQGRNCPDPIITAPVLDVQDVAVVDPCVKLKAKTNNHVFKNKVAQLNTPNNLSLDHEKGFIETKPPIGSSPFTNVEGNSNSRTIFIPKSLKAIGCVHIHNNDYINPLGKLTRTVKMLSPDDVNSLISFQENATSLGLDYSDVYVEMLSSQGHFAIKLLEPVNSNFFTNAQLIKFNEEYKLKAVEFIENENLSSQNLQKMLLSFLKTYGLENKVALYKATNNEATQWSRVTLDPVNPNNSPINSPCN